MSKKQKKKKATKNISKEIAKKSGWSIKIGELKRPRGRPHDDPPPNLFKLIAEKIPFEFLNEVEKEFKEKYEGKKINGVYVALDSMTYARYVGRGDIFNRLGSIYKKHRLELHYFSFYTVADKNNEREVENLLTHIFGSQLDFNERKIRIGIGTPNVLDWEIGTEFVERQKVRGRRRKSKGHGKRALST